MIVIIYLHINIWIHEHKNVNSKVKSTKQWMKESKAYHSKCSFSPSKRTYLNGCMKILQIPKIINIVLCFLNLSLILWKKNPNFAKPLKFFIHRRTVENLKQEG